jgi:hypothetical protein
MLSRCTLFKRWLDMMEPQLPPRIFPTASRSKHSHLVSYPVGAEILSRGLDGVPQHNEVTRTFTSGSLQRDLGKELIYVTSVGYTKRARSHFDSGDAAARGVYDPRWEIWMFTVPLAYRGEIKKALVEIGLPNMIKPWLIANANIAGKTGNAGIILEYHVFDKVLVATIRNNLQPDKTK